MKNSIKLFAAATMIALSVSCSKDRITPEPEPAPQTLNEYGSLNQFYNTHKQPEQEYIITQDGQCPLTGTNGTRLCISRADLVRQDGDSVQLPYSVKLIELLTPKDMILYQMPTVANNSLLVTGGQIKVTTFKDGEPLLLRYDRSYTAQVPATNPDPAMEIFYGIENGSTVIWVDSLPNNPLPAGPPNLAIDSSNAYYNLPLYTWGWINCDYFYSSTSPKTTINFTSSTDDLTNVAKFIYFTSLPSVMGVSGNTSGEVPVGLNVKVICFASDASGKMFSFYKELNISSGQTIDVTLTETTESALISLLESF